MLKEHDEESEKIGLRVNLQKISNECRCTMLYETVSKRM